MEGDIDFTQARKKDSASSEIKIKMERCPASMNSVKGEQIPERFLFGEWRQAG